jgi:hypothetical protein
MREDLPLLSATISLRDPDHEYGDTFFLPQENNRRGVLGAVLPSSESGNSHVIALANGEFVGLKADSDVPAYTRAIDEIIRRGGHREETFVAPPNLSERDAVLAMVADLGIDLHGGQVIDDASKDLDNAISAALDIVGRKKDEEEAEHRSQDDDDPAGHSRFPFAASDDHREPWAADEQVGVALRELGIRTVKPRLATAA